MPLRLPRADRAVADQLRAMDRRLAQIQKQLDRPAAGSRAKITDKAYLAAARPVVREGRTLLGHDRLWILWQAVQNVAHLGLPAAEVGSYRGGSAAFLAAALRDAVGHEVPFEVVDTFEGHPEGRFSEQDSELHTTGLFSDTSVDDVRAYLSGFERLTVHAGEFGAVKDRLPHDAYGFAHVDVDLYEATLDALRFFTSRMPAGGIVVVDDFDSRKCPGVRKAVEALLAEDPDFQLWNALTEQAVLVRR